MQYCMRLSFLPSIISRLISMITYASINTCSLRLAAYFGCISSTHISDITRFHRYFSYSMAFFRRTAIWNVINYLVFNYRNCNYVSELAIQTEISWVNYFPESIFVIESQMYSNQTSLTRTLIYSWIVNCLLDVIARLQRVFQFSTGTKNSKLTLEVRNEVTIRMNLVH